VLVLGSSDAGIGLCPEWRSKLIARDAGCSRPKRLGGVKIQALVQIDANAQSLLID
jgi:hypothetical protein